jgi:hypothetical protein
LDLLQQVAVREVLMTLLAVMEVLVVVSVEMEMD